MKNLAIKTLLLGCLSAGNLHAAPPVMYIDYPANGDVVSGVINVFGWATGTPAIKEITLTVDGQHEVEVGHGGGRSDVGDAFPDIAGAGQSGFALALNTRLIANGPHTLRVQAENVIGEKSSMEVSIITSNAPGGELPSDIAINLSHARTRIINATSLVIEKATVNGVQKSLVLEFDTASNHFVITSFAGVPSTVDHDGDAVPDDMDDMPDDPDETFDDDDDGIGDNQEYNELEDHADDDVN